MGIKVTTGFTRVGGHGSIYFKTKLPSGRWLTYSYDMDIDALPPAKQGFIKSFAENKRTGAIKFPSTDDYIRLWGKGSLAGDALMYLGKYSWNKGVDQNVLARETLGALIYSDWCARWYTDAPKLSICQFNKLLVRVQDTTGANWVTLIESIPRQRVIECTIVNETTNMLYSLVLVFEDELDLFRQEYHNLLLCKFVNLKAQAVQCGRSTTYTTPLGVQGLNATLFVTSDARDCLSRGSNN